ncbi:hypothetical protein ACNSTU_07260 [Aquisalimonas sp. APHAB1-3]|uniref:hypothetical protein n=1 Tax=Aquisalimonas sp. APHAB1-3 TaxID=3402080 RepID=UPI003AAC8D1F
MSQSLLTAVLRNPIDRKTVARILQEGSYQVDTVNSSGMNPLKAAVMNGDAGTITSLAGAGFQVTEDVIAFAEKSYPHKPDVICALHRSRSCQVVLHATSGQLEESEPPVPGL